MKNLKFIYPLLITLLLVTACSKDDGDEIPSGKFDGSKNALEEFYNPDVVKALNEVGFTSNTGFKPPNIEGSYLVSPAELKKSTAPGDYTSGWKFGDVTLKFLNQNNEESTIDYYDAKENINISSMISGDGSNFSVYLKITLNGRDTRDMAYAFSGKITDDGIRDCQVATIMIDDHGVRPGKYFANNTGRLLIDTDGLSKRITTKAAKIHETNDRHSALKDLLPM